MQRFLFQGNRALQVKPAFVTILLGMLIMSSCNNEGGGDQPKNDSAKGKPKDSSSTTQSAAFNGNFPYLTMEKTALDNFFRATGPGPHYHKLVFRFQFDDATALPSLTAYGANSVLMINPTPLMTLPKNALTKNLTGAMMLGNLELTLAHYEDLKKKGSYPGATHLIFIAKKDATNNVSYDLLWGTMPLHAQAQPFTEDGELNPSPPAVPGN